MAAKKKEPWNKHFFHRHADDDPEESTPARDFLSSCPEKVQQTILAVLDAVADAPPPAFSGGGKWEAMHDEMAGFYEVRVDGPKRTHYRLFCLLERDDDGKLGLGGPSIIAVDGRSKPFKTEISRAEYAKVKELGDEYRKRIPRNV